MSTLCSGAGGWSPSDSDHYQWLQVDFGNRKQISAIATQGRYSSSDWVTQYRMLYSDTGRNWKPYHQDGNIWVSHWGKARHTVDKVADVWPLTLSALVWPGWSLILLDFLFLYYCSLVLAKWERNANKGQGGGNADPHCCVLTPHYAFLIVMGKSYLSK